MKTQKIQDKPKQNQVQSYIIPETCKKFHRNYQNISKLFLNNTLLNITLGKLQQIPIQTLEVTQNYTNIYKITKTLAKYHQTLHHLTLGNITLTLKHTQNYINIYELTTEKTVVTLHQSIKSLPNITKYSHTLLPKLHKY